MSIKKTYFPYYQIKEGETLNMIAKKFDCDATKLLLTNNIAPQQVKAGKIIKIQN